MCTEKTIKLSLDQARKMYGKNPEMDELLLANFSKEELTKKELPKSWDELESVKGYFISSISNIVKTNVCINTIPNHRCNFVAEKQARSALAMAQLSQLMDVYNDGFSPDWDSDSVKYVISRSRNKVSVCEGWNCYEFLAFKSKEIANEFLKNFESLIKQYFMID